MTSERKLLIAAAATIAMLLIGQAATVWLVMEQRQQIALIWRDLPDGETGEPSWARALSADVAQATSNARDAERAASRAESLAEVVCKEIKGGFYC